VKRDFKRHKLLELLSDKRLNFESNQLPEGEHLGISFYELTQKMKCDIFELNLIASELYANNEIKHHNAHNINGLYCEKEGLTSFANNKYKARYWRDIWTNLFTISQIIVPILALVIALVAVIDSRQNKLHTEEIQLLRIELFKLKEKQDSQTKTISILQNNLKSDSLTEKLNDK
jgi:hypothetical protein